MTVVYYCRVMKMKNKYSHLLSPIILANTYFRNRIFASPVGFSDNTTSRFPTDDSIAFYERKARGGAAAVCIASGAVDLEFGSTDNVLIHIENRKSVGRLFEMSRAIAHQGSVASIELQHGGASSFFSLELGKPLYGPVDFIDRDDNQVLEMPEEIIERTIERFARAAAWVKFCGFNMITLHGGHGWLISQFLNPYLNNRKDKWGGSSIENRARLPLAIVEAVRKAVGPNFPIEMRISANELYPKGAGLDNSLAFTKLLDGKVDLIHVSGGSHEVEAVKFITHPSMFLEDGVFLKDAAEIKKNVKNSAVGCVAGFSDPDLMEEAIASGRVDVIHVARALLADPDLPNKLALGKADEVKKCIRCLQCYSSLGNRWRYLCAINPETGHELEIKYQALPKVPKVKKKVLVIGGGIAGMQAALTAAELGHNVILCEKTGQLGGVLRCEEKVPFKNRLTYYLDQQAKLISRAAIDVRLNTEVTVDLAKEVAADVIIAALGSRPVVPNIDGIEKDYVMSAEEGYTAIEKVGKKVIIIGGGLVGTELALYLAQNGRSVNIIEILPQALVQMPVSMTSATCATANDYHGVALRYEVEKYDITFTTSTKVLEIIEKGVIGENENGRNLYEADTVIYAVGQKPLWEEANALHDCAPLVYQVGDCMAARNIFNANSMAYIAANNLGTM
ncbi:MAG: NAD(P)/FAD-dependent oxidoreductase [Prevotella sp.]|jgi:2,4-dienoyl-CoA reductase-like NADH-dependent reductase (Old Yellow Enzyme family)/thioredoxin reductase|nr:NAD(P)/FAD-dependent oxidoreductase [Prevotella sp.]